MYKFVIEYTAENEKIIQNKLMMAALKVMEENKGELISMNYNTTEYKAKSLTVFNFMQQVHPNVAAVQMLTSAKTKGEYEKRK